MIDIETVKNLLVVAVWSIPLITAIVEVIKRTFPVLGNRFIPLVSMVVGIGAGLLLIEVSIVGGFVGLILGLSACGLFEISKTTIAGK
jgi:hypothetical protein